MNNSVRGLALVILALGAVGASADDFEGYYAGVGFGTAPITAPGTDEDGTGFKVFAGYSFGQAVSDNELLALEVAYIDGGDSGESFEFPINLDATQRSTSRSEVETKVASLSLLGTLPITAWFGAFAKVGYAYVDMDTTFTSQRLGRQTPTNITKVNNVQDKLTFGGGLTFSFGKSFQARAEYEYFDLNDVNLEFISLSGIFKFR
jgi:opacity protein-like surface antigen